MKYTSIDSDTIEETGDAPVSTYSIASLQAGIDTAHQRISQKILNALTNIAGDIASDLSDIAAKQAILDGAAGAGATIPDYVGVDSTGLQNDVAALLQEATSGSTGTQPTSLTASARAVIDTPPIA